jgi:hypothetical protein
MSDIVRRLREQMPRWNISTLDLEAAMEIERLEAEVELWKDRCDSLVTDMQAMERSFNEAWQYERHG